jgi:tRNA A-37 threonylcarbamoyl transferase component Bud32
MKIKMKRQKNTKTKTKRKNIKYKRRHNMRITKKSGSRKRTSNIKKIMINYGGAPFVQGGFGCIFSPALRCKDVGQSNSSHYDHEKKNKFVSKLIEAKYAKREYDYVVRIKKKLQHLPNEIKKYLSIDDFTICNPDLLNKSDTTNIESVCETILSYVSDSKTNGPVNAQNINDNLDKFKIINMPKLGKSLHDYVKTTKLSIKELIFLNNIIIKFVSVVIPTMNRAGVIHGDLKSANILFSDNMNVPVLIDWGLSYLVPSNESVPEDLFGMVMQYQHPFSTILFSKNVLQDYEDFLENIKKLGKKIDKESLRIFATAQYSNFKNDHNEYNKIHKYLASVFIDAYKEDFLRMIKGNSMFIDDTITEDIYINYVINYVVDVLFEYTNHNTNTINLGKYFKHVYMHNVDIWGIMSIYYELIKKPIDNYVLSSKEHKIYIQMLMNLLVKNIFENGNKVINIGKLVHDIKKVNLFLSKLRQYEEYKKNMNKITPYEDIVSENIHENVGDKYLPHVKPQPQPQPQPQPLVNNMKVNDSIAVRKLQLHRSVKRANLNPHVHQSMIPISNNLYRSQNRHNRTQRINVIKI